MKDKVVCPKCYCDAMGSTECRTMKKGGNGVTRICGFCRGTGWVTKRKRNKYWSDTFGPLRASEMIDNTERMVQRVKKEWQKDWKINVVKKENE